MLVANNRLRVYVSREPCDMRKSFNGLSGLVRDALKLDPLSGHLFCFFSRRRTQVKVLYWDTTGYCLWSKQLVRGRFSETERGELMLPELKAEYEDVATRAAHLNSEIEYRKCQLEKLQEKLWGRSSERRVSGNGEQELGRFPAHLRREVETVEDIPEGVIKEDCYFVEEKITERLAEEPSEYYVVQVRRKIYKQKDTKEFHNPPAPEHVFGRCSIHESFLVMMIIKKFLWHLPLNRQHQQAKLSGIELPRSNFPYWVIKFGALLLPVAKGAPQRNSRGTNPTLRRDPDSGRQAGWSCEETKKVLKPFRGTLVSDAYQLYAKFVAEFGNPWQLCFMHIRRNFVDAAKSNKARSDEALDFVSRLYQVEEAGKDKPLRASSPAPDTKTAGRFFRSSMPG